MALNPGDTIGIIGGGQLGRMMAMAAARLDLRTIVLDPSEDAPAIQCASGNICARYDDRNALQKLAEACSVITYEFENVDLDAIRAIGEKTPCHPDPVALETSQDRLVEKQYFQDLGIPTAPFFDVPDTATLNGALEQLGGRGILKTRRFGYDGKGQLRLSPDHPERVSQADEMVGTSPCILEGFIDFEREISVVAARDSNGRIKSFDPAENVHRDGILRTSTVPANISQTIANEAITATEKMAEALGYVGTIAIEFFVMADGQLIANEFAPRVHNSGHWTEAACTVSQFEQHIRAVAGLPLGDPVRHSNCVMENLIGDDIQKVPEILKADRTKLHMYGKRECRPGRKMGHFTRISPKTA